MASCTGTHSATISPVTTSTVNASSTTAVADRSTTITPSTQPKSTTTVASTSIAPQTTTLLVSTTAAPPLSAVSAAKTTVAPTTATSSVPIVGFAVTSFSADPSSIDCSLPYLQTILLSWTTVGATSVSITTGGQPISSNDLPANGSAPSAFLRCNFHQSQVFTLTALSADGLPDVSATVEITIQ